MLKPRFAVLAAISSALLFAACCTQKTLTITAPADGAVVPTQKDGQKAFLSLSREERREKFASAEYRKQMKAVGFWQRPVTLSWSAGGCGGDDGVSYEVRLFKDGADAPVLVTNITAKASGGSVDVDNLEIARNYRWTVSNAAAGTSAEGRFATEDLAPRFMRAGKLDNFRDLGGRVGLNGRRVKQGIVYRNTAFNYNAETIYYTPEEVMQMPGERAKVQELLDEVDDLKKAAANPAAANIMPLSLSPRWRLFLPAGDRDDFNSRARPAFIELNEVPDEFLGAKGRDIEIPDGETYFLDGKANAKGPAVFMQTLEAPEDGYFAMSAGGDFYWSLRSNGRTAFDRLWAGNTRAPYGPTNYTFLVPVRKGSNIIAVTLFTGADSWSWGCKSATNADPAAAIADSIAICEEAARDSLSKVLKERRPSGRRLDDATMEYLRGTLGIKSDIDLRSDGECYGMTGCPLGPSVTWFHYSSAAYGGMRSEWGKEAFRKVFRVFLDEKNYPIDFHCIAGQDRTGAVAFIINGLLGVDEEELYRDWESTGFWNPNPTFNHARLFDNLVRVFDAYPGDTINERIEAYVLALGFTRADIDKLRSIMLE